MVMKLKQLRTELSAMLKEKGIDSPDADISVILMHLLKLDKTQLVLGDRLISDEEYSLILTNIQRLTDGEPVQYITGFCEFMSLKFITRPGVLIPRADTEILVEAVLDRLDKNASVADFCCGSGCIGISLAHYAPDISVTALDISDDALTTAKENAALHGVSDKVKFINTDILRSIPDAEYDCIVSNPPYIRSDVIEALDPKVRDMEPRIALDGGDDGLIFYRRIAEHAPLRNGGLLAFEIGFDQGTAVCNILNDNGYNNIELLQDIENRDRVVLATKYLAE